MRRPITLMLAALLAVASITCLIVYLGGITPPEPEPDYTDMNRQELSALVAVNPNWHEPRAQLAQLLLQEENAASALQHMLVLAWAGWDTDPLESDLVSLVQNNPSQADSCLTLLAEQRPSWLWPKELTVKIATVANRDSFVLDNLSALLKFNSAHPLAINALEKFQKTNPVTAWEIGNKLGSEYLGQVAYSIATLAPETRAGVIRGILEKHPEQPLAQLVAAYDLGGSAGLDTLLTLEEAGLEPWDSKQYSRLKLDLLFQTMPEEITILHWRNLDFDEIILRAENVIQSQQNQEQSLVLNLMLAMEMQGFQPADGNDYSFIKSQLLQAVIPREAHHLKVTENYFANVLPAHIFYTIENWMEKLSWAGYDEHGQMQAIETAAGVLAQMPGWDHIETVLNPPPAPACLAILTTENRKDQGQIYQLSLSPDGTQLIYFTAKTIWWYDLEKQQYRLVQTAPLPGDYFIHWSPNSRTAVLERQHPEFGNLLQFYSTTQGKALFETEIHLATVLGWQDNTTLLLSRETANGFIVSSLNQITRRSQVVTILPHQPVLTPAGKIAWAQAEGKTLTISIQDVETKYELPCEGLAIAGWLPGDRGVLLQTSNGRYLVLDFATGKTTELEIRGTFLPHPSGWRIDNKIPGTFSLGLLNHIMILDLEDMSLSHTGILSYYGDFSGPGHYWHIHSGNIYIYEIQ